MSMPKIPDLNPEVTIEIKDTIGMLLSSIALEEIGLSHIINAEAEKIQFVLGTLERNSNDKSKPYKLDDILKINKSVNRTLNGVLQNQLLLQMKLQDTIDLYDRYLSAEEANSCRGEYLGVEEISSCKGEYLGAEEVGSCKGEYLGSEETSNCKGEYLGTEKVNSRRGGYLRTEEAKNYSAEYLGEGEYDEKDK